MQSFLRSTLALAFLGALFLLNPASAEESNDFNEVDFYFYGDLDNGDGNISTAAPTSDEDTESDCPPGFGTIELQKWLNFGEIQMV